MSKEKLKSKPKAPAKQVPAPISEKKRTAIKADAKAADLSKLEAPKNTGDACIAFDLREIRSKVAMATDMLSISKALDDTQSSENSILIDFKDKTTIQVCYIRSGSCVTIEVSGRVFREGSFVVDASLFRAVKGNSPVIVLALNKKASAVEFRCGNTRGSVQMLATESEYTASMPDKSLKTTVLLPKALVVDTLGKLLFNSFDPGLPALGLPLHITIAKSKLVATSNDNIVGAMYTRQDKSLEDLETCVPGQAFTRIAKHMPADTLRCGFSASVFRIRAKGVDVIHPMVTYDLVDMVAWLKDEEANKAEFELVLPTNDFVDAIDSALCLSTIDKSESKITLEFEDTKGRVLFLGANTQSKSTFPVTKMIRSGKSMTIITQGKRILGFINILKGFKELRMRVSKGRAYLFAPDDSFCFMIPLN